MTTNVNLSPQFESLVKQKVASGMYASVSEVVREALRLLDERDRLREAKLERLRQDIIDGINSGPPIPWDSEKIKEAGRTLLAKKRENRDS